jgi:hypothetical protein
MSSIEQLKSEAAALEAKARAQGHPMKHCDALEQVARNHGYDSWRACRAILGDPISATGTALPEKPPINNIEMKRYTSRDWNFALDVPVRWNAFPAVPTALSRRPDRHASGVYFGRNSRCDGRLCRRWRPADLSGGNGHYWNVGYRNDEPWCMEVRKPNSGMRAWQARRGEYYLATTGRKSGPWKDLGRPPQKLTGVGFISEGFDSAQPFRRMP